MSPTTWPSRPVWLHIAVRRTNSPLPRYQRSDLRTKGDSEYIKNYTMHMLQEEAGTLTNQRAGELRDEVLKSGVITLEPSNKGIRSLALLSGGLIRSLGSPCRRGRFRLRFLQLALKV